MATTPTPAEIERMRAQVVAHDQAEADKRRDEQQQLVKPIADAWTLAKESAEAVRALVTPDLAARDSDLWDRLRTWLQVTDGVTTKVDAATAVPVAPVPLSASTAAP